MPRDAAPEGTAPRRPASTASVAPPLGAEVFAGATAAFVSIPLGLAIGTLAFGPLGADYVNDGARAGLLAGAFGGLLVSLLQTRSFVISTTSSATGLIIAACVAQMIGELGLPPEVVVDLIALLVTAAGLITVLLGLLGLGRAVAFTPQPIFAGFVSGVGVFILLSQVPKLLGFGRWPQLGAWLATAAPEMIPRAAFGVAITLLMLWAGRRRPQLPNIAVGFVVGTALHHLLTALWPGMSLGPMIGAMPSLADDDARSMLRLGDRDAWRVAAAHWQVILGAALPLALVLALESMMARRLAESLADLARAPMRNLAVTGLGCMVSGATGGIAVSGSPAQVMANFRAGGRGKVSAATVGLVLVALTLFFPRFTAYVPAGVPAAVLIVVGLRLIDAGFLARLSGALRAPDGDVRRRARFDLIVFVVVMLPTAAGEIIPGVVLGILMSVAVFLARMGRPVVRRRSYGDARLSKRIRCTADADILARHGGETLILELEGVLFFGNADALAQVLGRIAPRCRQVVIDMRRIADIDSTGASILAQAIDRARRHGCEAAISDARGVLHGLYTADTSRLRIHPDVDSALEWAEDRILARHGQPAASATSLALAEIDMCTGLDTADLAILDRHLETVRYAPGDALCHAGEPADRLWMLMSGGVSIRTNEASMRRIVGLGPGTTVGEMALIEHGVRSASAIADEPVEARLLTAASFEALLRDHPRLANRMMHNLARELVRRLRNATKELARSE